MSLVFSDTSTYKGIIQEYEREIGVERGFISGNADRLLEATAAINLALDDYFTIALTASGTWQLDDSNYSTSYPIITTNLVNGTRDYAFTADSTGALILDIYRVMVADQNGIFSEITPIDQQSDQDVTSFFDGRNQTGIPSRYDKTANGIFLDPIPSYNYTNGLKVFINREASYFSSTDTTRKPGIPGLHHRYLALKPALDYARRNGRANVALIEAEVLKMSGDTSRNIMGTIGEYFAFRQKDVRKRMTAMVEDNS